MRHTIESVSLEFNIVCFTGIVSSLTLRSRHMFRAEETECDVKNLF